MQRRGSRSTEGRSRRKRKGRRILPARGRISGLLSDVPCGTKYVFGGGANLILCLSDGGSNGEYDVRIKDMLCGAADLVCR